MPDELQLLIEKLVYGGDGLGHADGNTVFAPHVLPGEEIRAEITSHTAEPLHYRNRAQWAVSNANPRALGYYLPESSAIVPIDHCDVLSPGLVDTFARLQEVTRSGSLPSEVLEIEAFVDSSDAKVALNVAFKEFRNPVPELTNLFHDA